MINLCDQTKKELEPSQVNDFMTLLACNRRQMPAYLVHGDLRIETNRSTLIKVGERKMTPMAVASEYHTFVFDQRNNDMDWENPLIVAIASIKKTDEGFVAYSIDDEPVTLLPLSGVQQLYNADPNRFL